MSAANPDPTEKPLDVLFVSPERFRASPQIGVPCAMTWHELGLYLSRPSIGETKGEAGAWSPALYDGNLRRKANLVSIGALVVDVDEAGDVDNVADIVGRYDAIVHETFSSTNDGPRCRVVLRLAAPIDATMYEATHKAIRGALATAGVIADEGAKDASRLSYSPVRRSGAGYRFRQVDGILLDAKRVLAAQPSPRPRPSPRPVPLDHRDAYVRAALQRAADAVSTATEGMRHYTVCKEAFALERLGLGESAIEGALLPAFVASAGERREHEGRRTIRDAVRARRGGA
jgi:hypothetical protein